MRVEDFCGTGPWRRWLTWRIIGPMGTDPAEWSVSQARDKFSDAVNRAAFGGEVTYVTRGRSHVRAAAIVPAGWVEAYEEMVDREDGAIATERLRKLRSAALESGESRIQARTAHPVASLGLLQGRR